jgi:hypothetical protein
VVGVLDADRQKKFRMAFNGGLRGCFSRQSPIFAGFWIFSTRQGSSDPRRSIYQVLLAKKSPSSLKEKVADFNSNISGWF